MANEEYALPEYGKRTDYDSPYHPSAEFNPSFVFAKAGDPKAQAQYQKDLVALGKADKSTSKPTVDAAAGQNVSNAEPEIKQAKDEGERRVVRKPAAKKPGSKK